tara:strand:+ start:4853 stop:5782 length:930 start_codon:yes stop_codon:yes gene_type:complete
MDKFVCKVDGAKFDTEKELHRYLRKFKMRMAEYYQKYYPRRDLFTGELIKFKNKNHYFSNHFNSRVNMRKWLESAPEEEAREFCIKVLKERIERRGIKYSPTQVEMRTSMMPPIFYYEKLFDSFYDLCSKIGLKARFEKVPKEEIEENIEEGYEIIVDTREQKPLNINYGTRREGLKFADYWLDKEDNKCYVERKETKDFIGTFTGGCERFARELERAKERDAYVVVVVENSLDNMMRFNYLKYITKKVQVTPEFVMRNVRDIIQTHENVQFLFAKGRTEATRLTRKLFFSGTNYKDVDLQLAYDLKLL